MYIHNITRVHVTAIVGLLTDGQACESNISHTCKCSTFQNSIGSVNPTQFVIVHERSIESLNIIVSSSDMRGWFLLVSFGQCGISIAELCMYTRFSLAEFCHNSSFLSGTQSAFAFPEKIQSIGIHQSSKTPARIQEVLGQAYQCS